MKHICLAFTGALTVVGAARWFANAVGMDRRTDEPGYRSAHSQVWA